MRVSRGRHALAPRGAALAISLLICIRPVSHAQAPDHGHGRPGLTEHEEFNALYEGTNPAMLWVDAEGRPTGDASDALSLLRNAGADGLDPNDYASASLDTQFYVLTAAQPPGAEASASFETSLSAAMVRYLRDLHMGRVDPREAGFRMDIPADTHDFVALLREAVAGHRLFQLSARLTPAFTLYDRLRSALTRYRALAADPETGAPLMPGSVVIHPGDQYSGLEALRQRLSALGDLQPGSAQSPERASYEGAVVEAVRRFQARHGLEGDGIIGRHTQAALRVPLAARVRQIELALERLRWLPHLGNQRVLAVNIPMFYLWAWDSVPPNGTNAVGMNVVVGRALSTQTPVFVEQMQHIVFRPYWNVPPSILRNEVLPQLERDPDYLRRENMEIVDGFGDDARPVPISDETVPRLQSGSLRVRQRPGPKNSLGLVKFVFPNNENIYMHGTPAPQLFSRFRRDFSHGCVRLEDPVALAEWALQEQPEWTRARIVAAMEGAKPFRVDLARPIQVILFYITAVVMPDDGTVRFADDIYNHDAKLERALAARAALR